MSESELTQVLAHMPDGYLEACILDSLTKMFAEGDWKLVDSLLPRILELDGRNELKASALATGVKTALRQKEMGLALERYNLLDVLGDSASVVLARLDALSNLTTYLLPSHPACLDFLWQKIQPADLPKAFRKTWGRIGIKLACAYGKTGDFESVRRLEEAMETGLGHSLFQQLANELGKGIFGGR